MPQFNPDDPTEQGRTNRVNNPAQTPVYVNPDVDGIFPPPPTQTNVPRPSHQPAAPPDNINAALYNNGGGWRVLEGPIYSPDEQANFNRNGITLRSVPEDANVVEANGRSTNYNRDRMFNKLERLEDLAAVGEDIQTRRPEFDEYNEAVNGPPMGKAPYQDEAILGNLNEAQLLDWKLNQVEREWLAIRNEKIQKSRQVFENDFKRHARPQLETQQLTDAGHVQGNPVSLQLRRNVTRGVEENLRHPDILLQMEVYVQNQMQHPNIQRQIKEFIREELKKEFNAWLDLMEYAASQGEQVTTSFELVQQILEQLPLLLRTLETQQQLREGQQALQTANNNIGTLQGDLTNAQTALTQEQQNHQNTAQQLNNANFQVGVLQGANTNLRNQAAQDALTIGGQATQINNLQGQNNTLRAQNNTLIGQNNTLQGQAVNEANTINNQRWQIVALKWLSRHRNRQILQSQTNLQNERQNVITEQGRARTQRQGFLSQLADERNNARAGTRILQTYVNHFESRYNRVKNQRKNLWQDNLNLRQQQTAFQQTTGITVLQFTNQAQQAINSGNSELATLNTTLDKRTFRQVTQTYNAGIGTASRDTFVGNLRYQAKKYTAKLTGDNPIKTVTSTTNVVMPVGAGPATAAPNPATANIPAAIVTLIENRCGLAAGAPLQNHVHMARDKNVHIKGEDILAVDLTAGAVSLFLYDRATNQVIRVPEDRILAARRNATTIHNQVTARAGNPALKVDSFYIPEKGTKIEQRTGVRRLFN